MRQAPHAAQDEQDALLCGAIPISVKLREQTFISSPQLLRICILAKRTSDPTTRARRPSTPDVALVSYRAGVARFAMLAIGPLVSCMSRAGLPMRWIANTVPAAQKRLEVGRRLSVRCFCSLVSSCLASPCRSLCLSSLMPAQARLCASLISLAYWYALYSP